MYIMRSDIKIKINTCNDTEKKVNVIIQKKNSTTFASFMDYIYIHYTMDL
jgi:hypothetical protein